jgi:hypothetical protein
VVQSPTVLTALLQVDVSWVYACFICISGVGFVAGILQVKSFSSVVLQSFSNVVIWDVDSGVGFVAGIL